jgi:glyoxylase-like metal-dependent hydrolase (beta-lactamase superfamily II)
MQLGPMAPLQQNAFLVDDGDAVTLVDAGLPWTTRGLRGGLREAGYAVADLDRVLLTHYDLDHVGGLYRLDGELDAPVYIGPADAALARGEHDPPLLHHKGAFHRALRRLYPLPDDAHEIREVEDGTTVGGFTAYHTPGHNPGHTVYVHEGLGAAFLGDLVWGDDGELTTPILFDSYDMARIGDSVRAFAERAPAFEVACMGHGVPLTVGGSDALARLVDQLAA